MALHTRLLTINAKHLGVPGGFAAVPPSPRLRSPPFDRGGSRDEDLSQSVHRHPLVFGIRHGENGCVFGVMTEPRIAAGPPRGRLNSLVPGAKRSKGRIT